MYNKISQSLFLGSIFFHAFASCTPTRIVGLNQKVISKSLRTSRNLGQYSSTYNDSSSAFDDTTFDLTKFSMKYHSCASLSYFSIESDDDNNQNINQEEEGDGDDDYYHEMQARQYPYSATQVIHFKMCPADSCEDDSWSGCETVYGNYLITLEDYMEAQHEYNEEYLEQYCDYCEQCLYFFNAMNSYCEHYDSCSDYDSLCFNNDYNDDEVEETSEIDYSKFVQCTEVDVLEDSAYRHYCSYCKQCDYFEQYLHGECENYSICENYEKACYKNRRLNYYGLGDNDENDIYQGDDVNERVYLKIYCDGSMQIGLFSDQNCYNYIGDKFSLYNTTGLAIDEDQNSDEVESSVIKKDCIQCSSKNQKFYHGRSNVNTYEEDEDEENSVLGMCESAYEDSVKCNSNIPLNLTFFEDDFIENWNMTLKTSTCDIIEEVANGEIDQYGCIPSSPSSCVPPISSPTGAHEISTTLQAYSSKVHEYHSNFTNSINQKYLTESRQVSELQMVYVYLSIIAIFAILGKCCCCMRAKIKGNGSLNTALMTNERGVMV